MLGGIAFSVYEWLKCAFARHSFLIVEGSIDKMKNIYPLNSRFTLPFAFVLAVSLLAVSLMFMLPGGLLHAQTGPIEYSENGTGAVATFTAVDPEGESIVWSLAGADMDDFTIVNGVLRFKSPPDFEMSSAAGTTNTYVVMIEASDGGADTTATETVTINVTNVEEPGTVTLDRLQPQVGVVITATLDDPDNETASTATWQWYRGNSPIAGATSGAGTVESTYTPIAGDVGSVLRATAMYDDDEGDDKTAQEDSANAVREAPTSNVPPTFPNQNPGGIATTNQTREVAENTPAGTNIGAPITASDTDVLTYSLNDTSAESFDINRATGQLITKADLDFEGGTRSYTAMVTATDPFGAPVTAVVTIEVTDVNEDPSVTGAASIDHAESNDANVIALNPNTYTVTDADVDDDVNDDADADVKWSLSGTDAGKFDITGTRGTRTLAFLANPDYESPGDSGANNLYEVTVVVTDTKGNTDEQAVMVKVTNVEEPGAIEFSTLQPRVGFPVTATLTDPDNVNADSVEWQWYRGATITIDTDFDPTDANGLPQNECGGAITMNCSIKGATSAVYVPVAGDVGEILTAVATYTDGNGDGKDYAAKAEFNPLVNTINMAPVFMDQDEETEGRQTAQERTILENSPATDPDNNEPTPIGDPVTAMDEDASLTYSLGGPDAGSFAIARNTGQLQVKAALDKETKDTYTVTVTATDSLGASSTITVTIKVDNMDEMPDLAGEAPEEYAENGTAAVATFTATDPEGKSITWDLAGVDAAAFSIVNGVLRFENSPDYESPADQGGDNTYDITIEASDGGVNTTASKIVSIEVTNVDEDGTVMLSTLQPQVGRILTATLDDPDRENAITVSWQWYRGSDPISRANDGAGRVNSAYTPAAGDIGSTLRAQAMYGDGEGEDKTARGQSFRSVRRAPGSNTDPAFPDQDPNAPDIQKAQTREVAENTRAGTNLGAPVSATDAGDLLTYSLSGDSFDIVRSSGQIRTMADLDFESTPSYTVMVTATDPFGADDSAEVTITVTDVNEAPMLTGAATIDHVEGATALEDDSGTNVVEGQYAATDADRTADPVASLKWSLSGADASKFDISMTTPRTLSFKDAPDYESPVDSDRDNVYEVTVVVRDSAGNTDEQAVTVKVTNLEEDGTIELSTLQPRVTFPVTAILTDPDNISAGSLSWQWYKGDITATNAADRPECDGTNTANGCAIKNAISDTYTPVADDVAAMLTAVVQYTDGRANEGDAKDIVVQPAAQQVLADTRNKAPVFPDKDTEMEGEQTDQERSVRENTPSGMSIGTTAENGEVTADPVIAMDFITPNTGEPTREILTYSLGGPDAASFSIDRGTAVLSTKAALDKETKDTYMVTVTATDPSGLQATITVTIKVIGVDEAPEIMVGGLAISGMRTVDYAENGTDAVATYMVAGPDADSARWSLDGPDAGDFTISSRAACSPSGTPPTIETSGRRRHRQHVYMVTVKADDGTYTDTLEVTVSVVTDVDEVADDDMGLSEREPMPRTALMRGDLYAGWTHALLCRFLAPTPGLHHGRDACLQTPPTTRCRQTPT